jgi:hypothetical protein
MQGFPFHLLFPVSLHRYSTDHVAQFPARENELRPIIRSHPMVKPSASKDSELVLNRITVTRMLHALTQIKDE